jgi:NAD-dependent dihydropyrimidine dehydrogenase PreA subunit
VKKFIKVSPECIGCGICAEICPMDCLEMDDKNKPYLAREECWYCGACEKECPVGALRIGFPYLVR